MADATDFPQLTDKPKKRKSLGSKKELAKKARISNHTTGQNCHCTLLQCFEKVTQEDRAGLIEEFNAYQSKDEQDSFLCSLIRTKNVARRRPTRPEEEAQLNEFSYSYHVRVLRGGNFVEQKVCFKAFLAFFGITNRRVQTTKKALTSTGHPPKDKRGQHNNRPHKLSDHQTTSIRAHISSFLGRKSHYALGKLYLSAELNVSRMHALFREAHPGIEITYETYRRVFVKDFNIGFGYPRKDTCDEFVIKLEHISDSETD